MELRKIKKRLTAAYNYSFIRMTLNFYTCYEMMAEKTSDPAEETLALYDRYLGSLGSFLEGFLEKKETFEKETLLEELEELRQDTIKEMEKLTAYTDIFQAYEYVMNRVEGRFMPQLVGKKPENTDVFMEEILNYLTQDSDPSGFHERFQLVVSQLPVRFTKNKFFALIQEGLSIYKGAPEAGLDDMIYVLRCEALLNRPKEGTESWKELYPFLEEFNQTDFKTLEAAEYYHLSSKLEEVSEKITDATGDILMLMDLVNDLYVLLLCVDHAVSDLKDTQVMVEIMSEVLKLFLDKQWKEIPVETADLLPQLEGKQETYFEQWIAGEEIPMDELAKSNLPECKVLWKTELLLSGSAFASLEYKASEAMADESMISEKLDELFEEIRQSWKELPKVLTRAAMAKCLSRLPITFKTSDEAQAYIRNSLECCTDEIEKEACVRMLRSIME